MLFSLEGTEPEGSTSGVAGLGGPLRLVSRSSRNSYVVIGQDFTGGFRCNP